MIATTYIVLFTLTLIISFLAFLAYRRTKEPAFVVASFLLYYWSLFGSWFLIIEKSGGSSGMRYQYLESKLFPIELGFDYLTSITFYGLFVISFQLAILFLVRDQRESIIDEQPANFSHGVNLTLAFILGIGALVLVKSIYEGAAQAGLAAYRFKYSENVSLSQYTLYQIINRAALVLAALGMAIVLGKHNKHLVGTRNSLLIVAYAILLAFLSIINVTLGAKNEILCALLAAFMFYSWNSRKVPLSLIASAGVAGFIVFAAIDSLRGIPSEMQLHTLLNMSYEDWMASFEQILTSNEAFGAHFSMYGVIANEVPLTHGESLVTLLAGFVPRFLWPDRPDGVYEHYVEHVNATAGQGYSIHHATGWYLNFGVLGVIAGGVVLGLITAYLCNLRQKRFKLNLARTLAMIGTPLFVGYFPVLIRGGIEAYKGAAIDVLFAPIPLLALSIGVAQWKRTPKQMGSQISVRRPSYAH